MSKGYLIFIDWRNVEYLPSGKDVDYPLVWQLYFSFTFFPGVNGRPGYVAAPDYLVGDKDPLVLLERIHPI
jgi:hypothetical protein